MAEYDRVIVSCTHKWSLTNFVLGIQSKKQVFKFDAACHTGSFYLEEGTNSVVSGTLMITNINPNKIITSDYSAKLTFSIVNADANCKIICSSIFKNIENKYFNSCTITNSFELQNLISNSIFKKIKSDTILHPKNKLYELLLNVKLVKVEHEKYLFFDAERKLEAIDDDFEKIFENQKLSDVKLVTRDGKEISAHKAIIAARSEVFMKMFELDMKEKNERKVEISDVDYEILKIVVNYMYTGKLDNIDEVALEVLSVADKYNIEKLKLMCEKSIIKNLSVNAIIDVLIFADTYRLESLKNAAIEYIAENASDVTQTAAYEKLIETQPALTKLIISSLVKKLPI